MSTKTTEYGQPPLDIKTDNGRNMSINDNSDTFETPLIRQWFIYCGLRPNCLSFNASGQRQIKFFKLLNVINSKITTGPCIFYYCLGYGLDLQTSIVIGIGFALQHLTYENKTNLILAKSLDMKETLENPEACQEMHNDLKKEYRCGLFSEIIKGILTAYVIGAYPIYKFMLTGEYFGVGLLVLGGLLHPFHALRLYYINFSQKIFHKNKKEIKHYIGSIHDIISENEKGRSVEENLKLLEKNQAIFKYRMIERKKMFFFHPLNTVMGFILPLILIGTLVLRHRTNDLISEIIVHFVSLFFSVLFVMTLLYVHGMQLSQGPRVFKNASKSILSLRFIRDVEKNLNMKYDLFKYWFMVEQKELVTVKILGNRVDGDTTKKLLTIIASLCSLALFYVGRDVLLDS
jgi:hypothetical protein